MSFKECWTARSRGLVNKGWPVALLVVVALAASACGSAGTISGAAVARLVRAAASKTIAETTAAVVTLPRAVGFAGASSSPSSQVAPAVGTADFATGNGTFKLGGQTSALPWVVWQGDEYVYIPPSSPGGTALPTGKTWFTFNLATNQSFLQSCSPFVSWSVAFDTSLLLNLLRGVTNSGTEVGNSKVGGVPTTKYKVSIDIAKITPSEVTPPGVSGTLSTAVLTLLTNLTAGAPIPAIVWLDGKGRVVQESLLINPGAAAGSSSAAAASSAAGLTLTFSSFGTPPSSIAPPAASQVVAVAAVPAGTGPYKLCAQASSSQAPPSGSTAPSTGGPSGPTG